MLDWRDVLANVMLQIDIRRMDRAKYEPVARACSRPRGSRASRARSPTNCPAACASASRSAARWCTDPAC